MDRDRNRGDDKGRGLVNEGRDDQSLRLSRFNESLTRRDSTSMKFEWIHLLGEPAKAGTSDKFYSSTKTNLNDGSSVNDTGLTSDRKHYHESGLSGLVGLEMNVVSDNAETWFRLTSGGLDESRVCKSLGRESYDKVTLDCPVANSEYDTYCQAQSVVKSSDYGRKSLALKEKEFPKSFTRGAYISSGGDRLNAKMINSTIVHDGRGYNLRGNTHVMRISPNHIPAQEKHEDYAYREGRKITKGDVFSVSDDLHSSVSVVDHCTHGCLPVTSNLDSTVRRISECYEELPRESRVRYNDPYLQGKKIPTDNDMKTSRTQEKDKEVLDCTSTHASCTRELYYDRRNPVFAEDHESLKMLPIGEHGQHKVNFDHGGLLLEEDHGYVRSEIFPSKENIVLDETAHLNDYRRGSWALREKEFLGSFRRSAHIISGEDGLDVKMLNSKVVYEGHGHNLCCNSHVTRISPHHIPFQGKHEDYTYREDWEIKKDNMLSVSDDLHTNASVHNHHSHDCLSVTSNLDCTVGRINERCYEELPRESRVGYDDSYLHGKNIRGDSDMKDIEVLECTGAHASCGRELYCNRRNHFPGEDRESLKMLQVGEYGQHKVNDDQEGLLLEEDHGYVGSEIFPSKENDVLDETANSNDYGRESLAIEEKEFPGSFIRSAHISSSGDSLDAKMIYSTAVHEGYGHTLRRDSRFTNPHHMQVQGKHEDHTRLEDWEIEKEIVFNVSDDLHTNPSVYNYNHRNHDCLPVSSNLDYAVRRIDECYEELPRERRVRYDDPYLQGKKIPGDNDMKASHTQEQDREVLDCTSPHTSHGRELYCDRRSPLFGEDHESLKMLPLVEYGQYKINCDQEGHLLEEDRGYVSSETFLSEENDVLGETAGDFQQKLEAAECYLTDQSTPTLKRKHDIDDIPSKNYFGNPISGDEERGLGNYYQDVAVEESIAEDMAASALSEKLWPSHSFPQTERVYYETTNNLSSSSDQLSPPEDFYVSVPGRASVQSSGIRDIKKRLGPRPQDYTSQLHRPAKTSKSSVKTRLGAIEKSKLPVRQRLGPIPKVVDIADPGIQNQKSKKLCQRVCHDYNVHVQKKELSVADVISTTCETHENSKEFEQQVESAYFRLVKQLNENASQRRRILEQGKAGNLNCVICGSKSKDFVDTKSLVLHAFYCQKVGLRSGHLGYHRALCTLMGWKSKMVDGRPWFCELLSDTEALSSKEDLIIWPPVVIIHNSSLNGNDFDGRITVSVEGLESILRGMGFCERIKVCCGRPANNSIMVVKFNSTLSGLEAAQRLHNFYSETGHGKSNFENISSRSNRYTGEAPKGSEKKAEHVLYGYLGIADDLDKLDFGTKKRCMVKSKKEIQRIANAQLVN